MATFNELAAALPAMVGKLWPLLAVLVVAGGVLAYCERERL